MVSSWVITAPDTITKLTKWQKMCIKFEKQTSKSFQIEVCTYVNSKGKSETDSNR